MEHLPPPARPVDICASASPSGGHYADMSGEIVPKSTIEYPTVGPSSVFSPPIPFPKPILPTNHPWENGGVTYEPVSRPNSEPQRAFQPWTHSHQEQLSQNPRNEQCAT